MGEFFERMLPIQPFDRTEDRSTTATNGQAEVEHLHRYFQARTLCRDMDVLDLAAGEGYGSALLAQVASSVVGIESDPAAVRYARANYTAPNLRFEPGDARAISLPDGSVDRVISFGGIERIFEKATFLAEVRRVLRPGGVFLAGTPGRDQHSALVSATNPKHVHELTQYEFETLLHAHFKHVQLLGQRAIVGSLLIPVGQATAPQSVEFGRRGPNRFEMSDGIRPLYWFAAASDLPLAAPTQSYFFETVGLDDALGAAETARRYKELRNKMDRQKAAFARQRDIWLETVTDLRRARAELELKDDLHCSRLAEVQFHLDRLNRYGWTRLGLFVDRLLAWPWKRLKGWQPPKAVPNGTNIEKPPSVVPLPSSIAIDPTVANPDVSIVILSYAQCDYTLRCLASLNRAAGSATLEVMVSDDCSGDPEIARIASIPNLRVLKPPMNLQFLRHANWACAQSKGKYILLLNNDTEMRPGAIEALVEVAEAHSGVGLVGSKLIYPDGRLQEAGGIIWNDGSACNYGRSNDPDRPEYSYLRDAGYVSGASILIPRKIWDDLGGFDERYAPAYYEDSDFAFRVRERGLRVLYAPRSVVVHHEGISHGTDLTKGVKANQVRNMSIFYERWRDVLKAEYFPPGTSLGRARDARRGQRNILIIDHYVPEPDRDAGSRTMIDIIKNLQRVGLVVKFWPENLHQSQPYTTHLQALGVEIFYQPYWKSLEEWLQVNGPDLDLVLLSRPMQASKAIPALKIFAPSVPCIFYGHDLHSARMRVQADATENIGLRREAQEMERLERSIWRDVDVVTYPSVLELQMVRVLEPGVAVRLLQPYCFDDFSMERSPVASQTILFVGGFAHPPNIDAVLWFAQEVLPSILEQVPNAQLCIAGSNPSASVQALRRDNIDVTGSLSAEALGKRYATARVAVVPLRYGAGVKLKVVEALQTGLPLVTTTVGAQGILGLSDIVPVKDDPHELAEAIIDLMSDDAQWVRQSHQQRSFAKKRYSRAQAVQNIREIVDLALTRSSPGTLLGSDEAAG